MTPCGGLAVCATSLSTLESWAAAAARIPNPRTALQVRLWGDGRQTTRMYADKVHQQSLRNSEPFYRSGPPPIEEDFAAINAKRCAAFKEAR